jgi:hypothetical protein
VFVLSGRGLCDGPIPRPEESYRLWCLSVIKCKSQKPSTPAVNKSVEEGKTKKESYSCRDIVIKLFICWNELHFFECRRLEPIKQKVHNVLNYDQ